MSMGKTFTISEEAYANKKAYVAEYTKANYESITLRIRKGEKAKYKELAQANGMSLTELFIKAVNEAYGLEKEVVK